MKSKTTKLIDAMPKAARTMKVGSWIRPTALGLGTLCGFLPRLGTEYRAALESLDENDQFNLESALRTSAAHYKAGSDIFGVVGIPLFLGLFAFLDLSNLNYEYLMVYLGILVFYFIVYSYYRMMQSTAEALVETGALAREAPTDPHRPA